MNISFMTALSERLSINLPAIILRGIKMISCMAIMWIRIRSTAMMEQSFKRQIVKRMSGLFILNRKVKRNWNTRSHRGVPGKFVKANMILFKRLHRNDMRKNLPIHSNVMYNNNSFNTVKKKRRLEYEENKISI